MSSDSCSTALVPSPGCAPAWVQLPADGPQRVVASRGQEALLLSVPGLAVTHVQALPSEAGCCISQALRLVVSVSRDLRRLHVHRLAEALAPGQPFLDFVHSFTLSVPLRRVAFSADGLFFARVQYTRHKKKRVRELQVLSLKSLDSVCKVVLAGTFEVLSLRWTSPHGIALEGSRSSCRSTVAASSSALCTPRGRVEGQGRAV